MKTVCLIFLILQSEGDIVNRKQLEETYIINSHGIFAPKYTMTTIEEDINGEIVRIDDYLITQTSEESYREWLENKNKPSIPPVDETRIWQSKMEAGMAELALQTAKLTLLNK